MTPNEWRTMTLGKSYNMDGAYGYQCWDYFDAFIQYFKLPVSAYCSLTGYVCDLWRLRDKYGYSTYFEYITDPDDLKNGDWVIFDKGSKSHPASHVCMFFAPNIELGQNQGYAYVTEKQTSFDDMLGAFRFRDWAEIKHGASDITINGHSYSLYRQTANQKTVVLSAGINKLLPIRELDADVYVYAKVTGANFFNNEPKNSTVIKNPDPYGTTYGDISSPLNDVWRQLPNQNNTLYYDLNTGAYGDCTGISIDQTHNVYSPGIVYPAEGNYQYGTFIGIDCVNVVSRYSFCIRFNDGTYAVGIANQDMTPKQIAADFRTMNIENIAFMDGGGSAQFGRWNGSAFEYVRDTGRDVPSAVAIVSTTPIQSTTDTPTSNETQKDEEEPMSEQTNDNQPVKVENWTDPEPGIGTTLLERISALLSVKSIITIAFVATYLVLVLQEQEVPSLFENILTMIISFFFGYQFKKAEK